MCIFCVNCAGSDHYPPPITNIISFCEHMEKWMNDSKHVAAVHCKAGKGRTGTVIAAYLTYSDAKKTTDQALNEFGIARTKNNKGVTIPSQWRYVRYMEVFAREYKRVLPKPPVLTITKFVIHTVANFDPQGGADPYYIITNSDGKKENQRKKMKIAAFREVHERRV